VLAIDATGVAAASAVWDKRDTDREAASLARLRRLSPLEVHYGSWRRAEARRLRDADIQVTSVTRVHCAAPFVLSVAGALTRRPQRPGVPPSSDSMLLCPLPKTPPTSG
jgi:hypothetical protein